MDTFRYVLAVLTVISMPPAVVYWFIVHPFVGFWRRRGIAVTYAFLTVFYVASMAGLYLARDVLVTGDYGTNYLLIALALPFFLATAYIQMERRKLLTFKILAGLPEVDPEKHESRLLTEGIYGRIRHPRYVEIVLGLTFWVLIINYRSVYVVVLGVIAALWLVVVLEERELASRFGEAYEEYRARVPRFVPKRRG